MASMEQTLIKVVEIEGKGKGFVASQPLKGGQIVLQESPILTFSAFPLKHNNQQNECALRYCSHCHRSLKSRGLYSSCSTCSHPNETIFCSSKCESLANCTTHTPWVCQALKQLRKCSLFDHQPEELQVQARYLVAAYNLAISSSSSFDKLLLLHETDTKDMKTAKFLHSIISSLEFPKGFLVPSLEMTASLLSEESCNSFSLMEPFLESGARCNRAYGIYYNASFFNHDCLPNACRFDYLDGENDREDGDCNNTDIIVRMMHDVAQGEEICLSYFRVGLSYDERKKRLMEYFGFACFCDRCKVEMMKANEDDDTNTKINHESYGIDVQNIRNFQRMPGLDGDHSAEFFERYLCERENCGGTLAPLPAFSGNVMDIMECNFCGALDTKM